MYGLGIENQDLPGFISLTPSGYPGRFGPRLWGSGFLPATFQRQYINTQFKNIKKLVDNIRNKRISSSQQQQQLEQVFTGKGIPWDHHATILHQMGLDHEKLTYRYSGRDFRLTDVAGEVIQNVIA